MELRRREHERVAPQVGARRVDPYEKQDVPEQSAVPLEVLAMKEKSGEELMDGVVNSDSDSDSDSGSDYECDAEEVLVLGNKRPSVIKGSNQEKLTGKKRTADMLHEDLVRLRSPRRRSRRKNRTNQALSIRGESANKKGTTKYITLRSEPQTICHFVELLNEPQREKVKELGFGSLLDFRMGYTGQWYFVVWIMDHLYPDDQDPEAMVLYFGGNGKLSVTQHMVKCVMGLQKGKIDPPVMHTETRKLNGLKLLREKLGVPAGEPIVDGYLKKQIMSGGTDTFTMQCFMMIVFCKLMACSTCDVFTENAWSMVNTDFDKFGQMNWCKFIVDQVRYSANKWKEPGGRKRSVHGCPAFLVMYYLDNLDCEHTMRCVEVPRAKFFSKKIIQNLVIADMLQEEDSLPTFGKLTLRNQRGTCYDERAELSRHVTTNMSIPGTSDNDIVGTFQSPHDQTQTGDLSSHQSLCNPNKNRTKQHHRIEEQEGRREENEDGLIGYDKQQTTVYNSSELFVHHQTDGDIARATQGTTPSLEASAEFHGDPKVSAVPQGEHEVTGVSEDAEDVQGVSEDVVQLASTSMKEQVNDFMVGSSGPEILQQLYSLLTQIRASVALGVRATDLEQQVQELTEKLSNKEEELEATREMLRGAQSTIGNNEEVLEAAGAKLRTAQVFQLEAQSAVAAINCLALRLSATFVRLGSDPPSPSGVVSSSSSLEEAVKLLEDLVSRIEPVSRSHARSLARSSVGFGAAALLSREREKGVKALHDAVGADTRRFVQSQGPEFLSLVAQVVDAVQKQHGNNDDANTRS